MFVGAGLTIIVQSSSVFTSTLTPLAGAGLVSLERAYPLTLGSNIGTTTTSLLAALASKGNEKEAIQIALVHLCFNITGILLFYPIPFMRLPIPLAQRLGDITSKYRWFSIAYLLLMFFIFPAIIFGLSLAGTVAMYVVLIPITALVLVIILMNLLQKHKPAILPSILKDWKFLPELLRSLEPLDRAIVASFSCFKICKLSKNTEIETETDHNLNDMQKDRQEVVNKGFEQDLV
jgi:sodium-dependent phosphate cotransporter